MVVEESKGVEVSTPLESVIVKCCGCGWQRLELNSIMQFEDGIDLNCFCSHCGIHESIRFRLDASYKKKKSALKTNNYCG